MLRCYWLPILQKPFSNSNNDLQNTTLSNPLVFENMKWQESTELMPFIGALNYERSRKFYADIGFLVEAGEKHCRVKVNDNLSFWLQNYSNKQWIENSMVFLEVSDVYKLKDKLEATQVAENYKNVKLSQIKNYEWGDELFMHDPSGVLWHFCEYKNNK